MKVPRGIQGFPVSKCCFWCSKSGAVRWIAETTASTKLELPSTTSLDGRWADCFHHPCNYASRLDGRSRMDGEAAVSRHHHAVPFPSVGPWGDSRELALATSHCFAIRHGTWVVSFPSANRVFESHHQHSLPWPA